jgi:hypothetical protein
MSPPLPARLQTMIVQRRLREQATTPEAVAAIWQKAVESAADAELSGMSIDGALRSAYDAGHLAALALLGAYGLRTGSGQGHHEMAFAGAAATEQPGLDDLVPDSEEVRGLRKGSLYDPTIAGSAERDRALRWMRRTLPVVRAALVAVNPDLEQLLLPYPG